MKFLLAIILLVLIDQRESLPVVKDIKKLNGGSFIEFNPEYIGEHYQGDMIFPKEAFRGAAHRPESQRWPNGIIPYEIQPSISVNHSLLIVDAMRKMEVFTAVEGRSCIQFRPKTDADKIFITIRNGSGCSAYVGYLPEYNLTRVVTLMYAPPYTCMVSGIIQHELLHVLGFFHEQSRPDRDDYVEIQWANIQAGTESNFVKYSEDDIDLLGTEYDYGSVMHYESNAFSFNGKPTIVPTRNVSAFIGQRIGMSPIDILEVQRYYRCVAVPTTAPVTGRTTTDDDSKSSRFSLSESLLTFSLLVFVVLRY